MGRTEKPVKKILLIFLMASLSACQLFRKDTEFPIVHFFDVDLKNSICGRWEILNPKTFNSMPDKHLPLKECDGIIGFKYDDFILFEKWMRDRQEQ